MNSKYSSQSSTASTTSTASDPMTTSNTINNSDNSNNSGNDGIMESRVRFVSVIGPPEWNDGKKGEPPSLVVFLTGNPCLLNGF